MHTSLARRACSAEEFGAAPFEILWRGEKLFDKIEHFRWQLRQEPHPGWPRNVCEAQRDIGTPGKDNPLDLGPDRRQRRPGIIAAIEQRREPRLWNRLARRRNQRHKPPRAEIAASIRGTHQHDRAASPHHRCQCRNRVVERMEDDGGNRVSVYCALLQLGNPVSWRPKPIKSAYASAPK